MSQELVSWDPWGSQYQHYGPSARSDDDPAAYDLYPDELPTREDLLREVRRVNYLVALKILPPAAANAMHRGLQMQLDALANLPAADEDSDDAHTWKLAEVCRKHPECLADFEDKLSEEQRQWVFEAMADEGWDDGEASDGHSDGDGGRRAGDGESRGQVPG